MCAVVEMRYSLYMQFKSPVFVRLACWVEVNNFVGTNNKE